MGKPVHQRRQQRAAGRGFGFVRARNTSRDGAVVHAVFLQLGRFLACPTDKRAASGLGFGYGLHLGRPVRDGRRRRRLRQEPERFAWVSLLAKAMNTMAIGFLGDVMSRVSYFLRNKSLKSREFYIVLVSFFTRIAWKALRNVPIFNVVITTLMRTCFKIKCV